MDKKILSSAVIAILFLAVTACGIDDQATNPANIREQGFNSELTENDEIRRVGNDQLVNQEDKRHTIQKQVENIIGIDDACVVIQDDNVLIGLQTTEENNEVSARVQHLVKASNVEKHVHVAADEHIVQRIYAFDNQLRNGMTFDQIGANFTDILNDIARGTQHQYQLPR
ncbi:YhcN/YlaJ family sporulation lipoprotein [Halalkalibacter alkaliphilus]|uniref:YhcN/YlaJ family sporulation lipoprotein n=1 Tax=Halalkalibacter alkaliphilus TaxID=2917993 RepID=A0A9X2CW57_9BACI|nr:YhcN/YlaJ family sporulation lipoprotein [Halalkalibacter alkaliphilus]MCL7749456.1 YhcN/YlaJ family sporulation lipoprotein [Halalkalibacter alkaliphilus]